MNHYDDLQRFKDKTRNQQYDFKDLSAQNTAHDQGNWALINQLSPDSDESKLAMGGHVSLPQPQPVNPALFTTNESHSAATLAPSTAGFAANVEGVTTSVAPLLRDVAEQLSSTASPANVPVAALAPAPAAMAVAPAPTAVQVAKPAAKPEYSAPVQPAPAAAEPANYARLFAPKPADAKPATEKNQSLQTLLERIASCR